eukprot:8518789-Heterocapsa_arctica.AAC.1
MPRRASHAACAIHGQRRPSGGHRARRVDEWLDRGPAAPGPRASRHTRSTVDHEEHASIRAELVEAKDLGHRVDGL